MFQKRSSTNRLILATEFPAAGLPAVGSSVFQLQLPFAHVSQRKFLLCCSAVRWPLVPSVPKLVYASVLVEVVVVDGPCELDVVPDWRGNLGSGGWVFEDVPGSFRGTSSLSSESIG